MEERTIHHNLSQAVQGDRVVRSLEMAALSADATEFQCTPVTTRQAADPETAIKIYREPKIKWRGITAKVTTSERSDVHAIAPTTRVSFEFERELTASEAQGFNDFLASFDSFLEEGPHDKISMVAGPSPGGHDVIARREKLEDLKFSGERRYRILALVHGEFGKRKVKNIRERGPDYWDIESIELPTDLPSVIDDPSEFLQKEVPKADLLLALQENANAAQLIVDYVNISGARALLAPVDNSEWLPEGQRNQIKRQLDAIGVGSSFPRPFCVFEECGDPVLDEFARFFGRPVFNVQWEKDNVTDVQVIRGAPCGCSLFVAEKLKGVRVDEAPESAGLLHHHYPCLAAMVREPDIDDTLMHKSGFATKDAVDREIQDYKKKHASYLDPSGMK